MGPSGTTIAALETSVDVASKLFQNARAEYIDVLFAQRDLMDARLVLIETKNQQLSGIVAAYQSLGGGDALADEPLEVPGRHRPAYMAPRSPEPVPLP